MSYQLPVTSYQLRKTVSCYARVTGYWLLVTGYFFSFFAISVAVGAVEVENVTFGFGDGYKIGTWAPLTITVRNQDEGTVFSGELVVEVRSFSAGTPIGRYATPLRLIGPERQRKDFYVYCRKNATQLVIQFVPFTPSKTAAVRTTATRPVKDVLLPTPLARKDYFVLVLAPSGDKLKRFVDKKQLAVSGDAQVHVKYLPNSRSLPRDWIGYSAVDVLVVRETRLTERRIFKAQQTAILDWVQRGGTLIVSGGRSFYYLQGSFIEPFLPVELKGVKKTDTLPVVLEEELSLKERVVADKTNAAVTRVTDNRQLITDNPSADSHFEYIQFAPRAECEVLIGTSEQIYVAKRDFGDGQILCLAFDYNAPPFGVSQKNGVGGVSGEIPKQKHPDPSLAEAFWRGLLSKHGKSPRHLADRYALALQHEAEIHKHFLSEMPTRVPLIKLLAVVLPIYLLGFGGFLRYLDKSRRSRDHGHRDGVPPQRQKSRTYWIGGCLFVLLSVSIIVLARDILPNNITATRLSILSVYPERQRAHLQSYVSLKTAAGVETSIDFPRRRFVRHQRVEPSRDRSFQKTWTLVQGASIRLRDLFVDPWRPTTYVTEEFLALPELELPSILENTWRVAGEEMAYLGNVVLGEELGLETPATFDPSMARLRLRVTQKMPPDAELEGARKTFAQILKRDYVLRYLATEANLNPSPYFMGWISQDFAGAIAHGNINTNDEILVIFRPGPGQ